MSEDKGFLPFAPPKKLGNSSYFNLL